MVGLLGKMADSKNSFNCLVWFCFEYFMSIYYIIQFHHRNRFTLFLWLNLKKLAFSDSLLTYDLEKLHVISIRVSALTEVAVPFPGYVDKV